MYIDSWVYGIRYMLVLGTPPVYSQPSSSYAHLNDERTGFCPPEGWTSKHSQFHHVIIYTRHKIEKSFSHACLIRTYPFISF